MHVFKYPNNEFPHLNNFSFERTTKRNDVTEAKNYLKEIKKANKKSYSWSSSSSSDNEELDAKSKKQSPKTLSHSCRKRKKK